MNICYLCRTFHRSRGGMETTYYLYAKGLAARGHTVHIIVLNGQEKFYLDDLGKNIHIHKIDLCEEPFKGYWLLDHVFPLTNLRYALAVYTKLKEIRKTFPIDLVASPDGYAESFIIALMNTLPLHIRLHGHQGVLNRYHGKRKWHFRDRILWLAEKFILDQADGICAVSSEFAQLVKKIWRCPDLDIQVIHSVVDQSVFKPDPQIKVRKDILFVGRLEENKGLNVLIEAMPSILKEFPGIKFIFVGSDGTRVPGKSWSEYISSLFPKENTCFLGQLPTEKVAHYYQTCAVAVFPSLFEAGGNVALEAMACGCPTVATRLGGFVEFITEGEDGLLINPNDQRALSEAMHQVLTHKTLAATLSRNSVDKINRLFNIDLAFEKKIEAYKATINSFQVRHETKNVQRLMPKLNFSWKHD
jgi:glycosyltransferase involved in cell wall biosynthesis